MKQNRIWLAFFFLVAATMAWAQRPAPALFPFAPPLVARFQNDPRIERLDKLLPSLVANAQEWGNYPVLAGFLAVLFQRAPDRIDGLIPAQLDAKTADMLQAAFRLSGRTPSAVIAQRLAQAGHDAKLSSEFADLPPALAELRPDTATYMDILWGAYFASGDVRHAVPLLDFFATIANQAEVIGLDITRITVAMDTDTMSDVKPIASRYDRSTFWDMTRAATAELGLIRNAQVYPAIKQLLATYAAQHAQEEASKSLAAFLKHM